MKHRSQLAWIVAAALFVGAFSLPYGYYQFLRILVCSFAIWRLLEDWKSFVTWERWFLIAATLLYNPLTPVHFTKPVWAALDLILGAAFALLAVRWRSLQ